MQHSLHSFSNLVFVHLILVKSLPVLTKWLIHFHVNESRFLRILNHHPTLEIFRYFRARIFFPFEINQSQVKVHIVTFRPKNHLPRLVARLNCLDKFAGTAGKVSADPFTFMNHFKYYRRKITVILTKPNLQWLHETEMIP